VFAEDMNDNIYLISNTGKIQWKKKIDGRMLSEVNEVDALKNGKLQFLFNTEKSIYCVDRNGNPVSGFPVKLSSQASGPVTVFDYEKDKKYRVIVPCADKVLREYDVNGKQVDGWAKPETESPVTTPAKHIAIDDKDYLVLVDAAGNVYSYDRKGETRIKFHHKLPANATAFYLSEGTKLSDTYIQAADSTGDVYSLSFSDQLSKTTYLHDTYKRCYFTPVDLDGNGKTGMVFVTPNELFTYGVNKAQLYHFEAKDTLLNKLFTFTNPDGKARIGAVEPANDKIYLWDNTGNVCSGFPLYGALGFSIADMNGDGQHYLVTGADNSVYVYGLP
jgi:WD40 repeat protein